MKPVRWLAPASAAVLTAGAAITTPATASATPGIETDAVVMSQSTVNGIDYITRRITIQPGGSTGWHYHDGQVFGVVREGTLTRTMADCTVEVSPAGSAVTEESGPDSRSRGPQPGPRPAGVVG